MREAPIMEGHPVGVAGVESANIGTLKSAGNWPKSISSSEVEKLEKKILFLWATINSIGKSIGDGDLFEAHQKLQQYGRHESHQAISEIAMKQIQSGGML
jgi:CCR4-NOT transcriptional regulation complex NOT5 subunit